jgi:hypothetical protein
LKEICPEDIVAENSLTGMATKPKEMVKEAIERAGADLGIHPRIPAVMPVRCQRNRQSGEGLLETRAPHCPHQPGLENASPIT